MAAYFLDTSTVVKRYAQEIGTPWVQSLTAPSAGHLLALLRITLAETVAAVHKPDEVHVRTLVDLALPRLTGLLKGLERAASVDPEGYEDLHQIRILGKRLRYAMEVFADCFAPAFREELYAAVESMQEILGNANDSHVAAERLLGLRARLQALLPAEWKRYRPGIEKLLRSHEERLPREREHFEEWWRRWEQSCSAAKEPAAPSRGDRTPHRMNSGGRCAPSSGHPSPPPTAGTRSTPSSRPVSRRRTSRPPPRPTAGP